MATGDVRKGDWSVFTDIINLSIRSLSYDFNDKQDADLRMTGPTLGATFRW